MAAPGMLFTDYMNSVQQQQPMMMSAPMMTMPAQPMMMAAPTMPVAPGYVLQPDFGMIPVPPEAMSSNCSTSLEEDSTAALVSLTFRPKKLSDDDKEAMEKLIKEKIEEDLTKSREEVAAGVKKLEAEEALFWETAVKKNVDIYLGKIGCVASYIYEPEIKPDNSGVRTYQVEIQKSDKSPIKESLADLKSLNEYVKIIPVIRKKEGFPEVVFLASLRLAECQTEKHLKARSLTDKANSAQMKVVKAMQSVEDLTKPAVEAQADIPAKEAAVKRAEVTLASWNKYKELMKDKPEELTKATDEASKASSAKAKATAELDAATSKYEEALGKLRAAKQEVVAAEFDVQQAVDKADKIRSEVPATCELFNVGAAFLCSNGCGYAGTNADVLEHEETCDVEYSCDAPDCDYKGNFEDCQKHEAQCPKLKMVNTTLGFGAMGFQPQMVPMFQQPQMISAPMMMSAPMMAPQFQQSVGGFYPPQY